MLHGGMCERQFLLLRITNVFRIGFSSFVKIW